MHTNKFCIPQNINKYKGFHLHFMNESLSNLWYCPQEPANEATPAPAVWFLFSGDGLKSSALKEKKVKKESVSSESLWT